MSERQIELTWTCSACRTKNLGRHMVCQSCGDPKGPSEEYEMPADPSAVASVTDPELLRLATAGENWCCAYCGSNQRAIGGGCLRCGAGRTSGANASAAAAPIEVAAPAHRARRSRALPFAAMIAFAGAVALAFFGFVLVRFAHPPAPPLRPPVVATSAPVVVAERTELSAEVTRVSWRRTITIETWQLVPHEGFRESVPTGAIDVRAAGQREHHREDVFDHDETVYDDVEVPDGYRTETYTERVSCGQDCTTSPRVCRPVCTTTPRRCTQRCRNNKNGFATCTNDCSGGTTSCHDDCTGGTTTCATKYCNEQRARQIPKTRHEKRPRVVKKYRSEPRFAPWATYKTWEWKPTSTFDAHGEDAEPRWPEIDGGAPRADGGASADAAARAPKPGERREVREETFAVTMRGDDGRSYDYAPRSDEELARLAPGTVHRIHLDGARVSIQD